MLVWFACALGAAAASPLFRVEHRQLICSAAGHVKFVTVGDAGDAVRDTGALQDCPLCVLLGAPPQQVQSPVFAWAALPGPATVLPPGLHAARSAPPLPPRGPPASA